MTPAAAEEQAELRVLHERAVETGHELSQTLAALADRMTEAAKPRRLAGRAATAAAARIGSRARRAVRSQTRQAVASRAGRAVASQTRRAVASRAGRTVGSQTRQAVASRPSRAVRRAAVRPVPASLPKLAATAGVLLIAALAVTWQHRQAPPARPAHPLARRLSRRP